MLEVIDLYLFSFPDGSFPSVEAHSRLGAATEIEVIDEANGRQALNGDANYEQMRGICQTR